MPALLTSLQNEYDAVMVEMFALRKAYDEIREELAHALYANDSATRVVARLLQERDEARTALSSIRETLGHSGGAALQNGQDAEMADANPDATAASSSSAAAATAAALPPAALALIDEAQKSLSSARKGKLKRKPAGYATSADAPRFASASSLTSMHGTRPAGVTTLDISLSGKLIATGGRDKQVQVYDRTADKTIATLKGHTKEITHVVFAQALVGVEHGAELASKEWPGHVASSSLDGSLRMWSRSEEGAKDAYTLGHTITDFKGPVVGLAAHPTGQFVVAASEEGVLAAYDVASAERIVHVQTSHRFASLDVHPDGALIAVGTANGTVIIYDIHTAAEVASFASEAGSSSVVASVHFSENGYLLASATSSHAEIWDLRKLTKAGTIAVQSDEKTVVRFDPSAQLLAVVGKSVQIYANKTWQLLWTATDETLSSAVTDAKWTWTEGQLITSGMDRSVRTFAVVAAT